MLKNVGTASFRVALLWPSSGLRQVCLWPGDIYMSYIYECIRRVFAWSTSTVFSRQSFLQKPSSTKRWNMRTQCWMIILVRHWLSASVARTHTLMICLANSAISSLCFLLLLQNFKKIWRNSLVTCGYDYSSTPYFVGSHVKAKLGKSVTLQYCCGKFSLLHLQHG